MSLSDESISSLLTNAASPKGYVKVIYFKFSNSTTNDILKDIAVKTKDFDDQIFENIDNHDQTIRLFDSRNNYLTSLSSSLHKIKYIFIGNQPDTTKSNLQKITMNVKNKIDPYLNVNVDELANLLSYSSSDEMKNDFDITNELEVEFLNYYINETNNILNTSQIISHSLTEKTDQLFMPTSIFMYGKRDNSYVESRFIEIRNMLIKEFKQNESEYSVNNLITNLVSYMVPLRIINHLVKLHQDSKIGMITKIVNNIVVKSYICSYLQYNNITHNYSNRTGTNYPIDSNLGYYFNQNENVNNFYSEPLQSKNVQLSNLKRLDTLEDTFIVNKTIYIYNYFDIENHLKSIGRSDLSDKKAFYLNFIVKYFPNLTIDKVFIENETIQKIKTDVKKDKDVIINYSNLNESLFNYSLQSEPNIEIKFNKQYLITIRRKINLPQNFDFRNLFNELVLSNNIPFVKLRDIYGTKDIIYKVFKPSTERESEKHLSEISRDQLDEWIKFRGFEFVNTDLKKVKAHPKYISYKSKFAKIRKDLPIRGKIYITNQDGSFEIIGQNGNIFSNIDISNIINPPQIISNETEVVFYKNEFLYADIDLFKKEYLEFTLDTRYLSPMNNYLIENIKNHIDQFIDIVYSIESLKRYQSINVIPYVNYQNKDIVNSITNLIYKYDVHLDKTFKLDYATLEQVSYILHPFVIVKDELFSISTPIEYFDTDDKKWIKGLIKKINVDFTYDVQLHDPAQNVPQMITKENINKVYLRLRDGKTGKLFKLNYKQVSGFDDMSPINSFLDKLNAVGLDNNNQVKKLMDLFLIEREKAIELVGSYVEDSDNSKKTSGVNITFDYIPMLYKPNETKIGVIIENINSLQQIFNVNLFLKLFFKIALVVGKYLEKDRSLNNVLTAEIMDSEGNIIQDNIQKNKEEAEKKLESSIDNVLAVDSDEYSDIEDDDDDLFDESDEEIIIEEEVEEEDYESTKQKELTRRNVIDELLTDSKLSKGSNKLHSSTLLNRLKLRDPKLFDWSKEGTQSIGYSRTCQAGRQPQVLTSREKKEIDDEFAEISKDWENKHSENPLSPYSANDIDKDGNIYEYIDCDENTVRTMKPNQQCKSLKWGSAQDSTLHNWYICPKIFDLNTNKPVHVSELKFKKTDVVFNAVNQGAEWRIHRDTNPELNGKDILEFQPYIEKDGIEYFPWQKTKSDREPSIYKSLLFADKKEQSGLTPGLQKSGHPEGILMPCCFKVSKNVKSAFNIATSQSEAKTNYIQNWGHGLTEGRYGLLHKIMEKYFENTSSQPGQKPSAETGLIRNNRGCFVRYGIKNTPNSIFKIFSILHRITVPQIIDNILKKLTCEQFKKLNLGDLYNQFIFSGIQSPFQNFLEYVLSNQTKTLEIFVELLSRKKYGIVNKDINVIALQVDYSNNSLDLLCSNFYEYEHQIKDTVFLLKTGSGHFELLCKFNFLDEPEFIFNKAILLLQHKNIMPILDQLLDDGKCQKKNPSQLLTENNVMNLISNDNATLIKNILTDKLRFSIKNNVNDNNNKTLGVLLPNGVIVPLYPQSLNSSDPSVQLDKIPPVDIKTIEQTYDLINEHLAAKDKIEIIDFFSSDNNNYIVLNTGHYIRVNSIPEDKESANIIKTDYFEVDRELENYKESIKRNIYKPPVTIENVIGIIKTLKDQFSLVSILKNDSDFIHAVIIENSIKHKLIIPIQLIELKDVRVVLSSLEYSIIQNFQIENSIDTYMDSIVQFSRLSYYKIPCLPIRALFENKPCSKIYDSVILETGKKVLLSTRFKFNIWAKDTKSDYTINQLIDTPIVDRIFFNNISKVSIDKLNKRVRNNIRINYISSIYDILKNKIYELFQTDAFSDTKDYIRSIIKNPVIQDANKKNLIRPLMKVIFSVIIKTINEDITKFKDINSKIKCDNSICDNNFCVNEEINLDKFRGITELNILKLGILPIGNDDIDKVRESDIEITKKNITDDNIRKLETVFSKTLKTFTDMNRLCKIKFNINTQTDIDQLVNIQNKIFNEMIFNKYRSHELFNYINKDISNEDLVVNSANEFLFVGSEYTMSTLNQLYINDLNKYYNNILPFDKSIQRISSIQLDTLRGKVNENCKLSNDTNEYTIDQLKCGREAIKNENKNINNSLLRYLSTDEISDLKSLIRSI
jgi:hypothetical protein